MPRVGFEPTISAGERPKTYALDRAATGTGYYPINAHNVKGVELLKHIKIIEAAPTCFGLQRNHHQGATASA